MKRIWENAFSNKAKAVSAIVLSGLVMTVAFQNCSVRRMDTFDPGVAGLTSNEAPIGSGGATGSTSTGTGTTGTSGGGAANSCTAAPLNPVLSGFQPAAALASQDASVTRTNQTYMKAVTVSLIATNSCIEPNHSCTAKTTTGGTCVSKKMSTLSISFQCSKDPNSNNCDLITPGEQVDLANTTTGDAIKNLSIAYIDSQDSCDNAKTKTFMTMDFTTFKNIGGKVIFHKVDGTSAGSHFEVELQNVVLKTQAGTESVTISGTYMADVTCSTGP